MNLETYLLEAVGKYHDVVKDLSSHKSAENPQTLAERICGCYNLSDEKIAKNLYISCVNRLQPMLDGRMFEGYKNDVNVSLFEEEYSFGLWKYVLLRAGMPMFDAMLHCFHEFGESFISYALFESIEIPLREIIEENKDLPRNKQSIDAFLSMQHGGNSYYHEPKKERLRASFDSIVEPEIKEILGKINPHSQLKQLSIDESKIPRSLLDFNLEHDASLYIEIVAVRDLLSDLPLEAQNHIRWLKGIQTKNNESWRYYSQVGALLLLEEKVSLEQTVRVAVNLPSLAELYLMIQDPKKYVSRFLTSREIIFNYRFSNLSSSVV